MIYWAYICLTVALAAGLLGFGGEGGAATVAGQTLFFIFLGIAVILIALKVSREARDGAGHEPAQHHRAHNSR